jgi:hypothetical protein
LCNDNGGCGVDDVIRAKDNLESKLMMQLPKPAIGLRASAALVLAYIFGDQASLSLKCRLECLHDYFAYPAYSLFHNIHTTFLIFQQRKSTTQ